MKRIFFIFFCLYAISVSVLPVYGLNRAEIREEVRRLCGDYIPTTIGGSTIDTTKVRWQDSVLNLRIATIDLRACRESGLINQTAYITTVSSQTEYDLPSNFLAMKEAGIFLSFLRGTTEYEKLYFTTKERVIAQDRQFADNVGSQPNEYYVVESSYGWKIGLFPSPDISHTGTKYLKVDYIMNVSTMSADTDQPYNNLPYLTPYHWLIVYGVVSWCKADQYKWQESDYYDKKYNEGIIRMMYEVRQTPDFRGGIITEEYYGTRGGGK